MAPRKASTSNNTTGDKNLTWIRQMDDQLIDAFMHEYDIGNKVNGTFTSTAYDNIVKYLSALFGNKIDKEKVKNRWKTLKKNFSEVYDIFKNGMSGFSWDSSTNQWNAEPEVWDALIEANPKAAFWRNTPLPHYRKMIILYGSDRATGEEAETAAEMRKRKRTYTEEDLTNINDIDNLVSQNEVSLENFAPSINLDNYSIENQSPGANSESGRKNKKVAASKEKQLAQLARIEEAIESVASALRDGNTVLRERFNPQLSGEETLKMIEESGCDVEKIPDIYCFLMNDVAKLRTVIQCPPRLRKEVIMKMVFGA